MNTVQQMKKGLRALWAVMLAALIAAGIAGLSFSYAAAGQAQFKESYAQEGDTLHVEYQPEGKYQYKWYVGDQEIRCKSSTYTLTKKDMDHMIRAEVWSGGRKVSECSKLYSNLPVLYINTENQKKITSKETYVPAELTVQGSKTYTDASTLYHGAIEIRGRGNSTWQRFDKKPYKLKLGKKSDLLGLGRNKHWALLANYIDESGMRNMLASYYGKNLGTTAMDGIWVDVVLNGKPIGMYQLSEQVRIDKNRVDIHNWADTADDIADAVATRKELPKSDAKALEHQLEDDLSWITSDEFEYAGVKYTASDYYDKPASFDGGYLLEADDHAEKKTEPGAFETSRGITLGVKKPDGVTSNRTLEAAIHRSAQQVEDVFYSTDHTIRDDVGTNLSYVDLMDMDSLTSFWLASELMRNEVGLNSTYFYKDLGEKFRFGPIWDFDWSSDSVAPFGGTSARSWATAKRSWFSAIMKDPYFAVRARALYQDKSDMLAESLTSGGIIDQWHDTIQTAALANESLWHYSRGFEDDTAAMKAWLRRRLDWMDAEFATDQSAMASLGVPLNDAVKIQFMDDAEHLRDHAYAAESKGEQIIHAKVDLGSTSYTALRYYINGHYMGRIRLNGESSTTLPLNESEFTEKLGDENVFSVWAEDGDGNLAAQQYATLTFTKGEKNYVTVTMNERGSSHAVKVAPGKSFRLPEAAPSDTMECTGWRQEGSNVNLKPGTKITVNEPVTFTARYVECSDGDVNHTWKTSGGKTTCTKCGIIKTDRTKYIDIADCDVSQSSRYWTQYTGDKVAPQITVSYAGRVLTEGKDYTMDIRNNVNIGYATYTITGSHDAGYDGTTKLSYRIIPRNLKTVTAKVAAAQYEYDKKAKRPAVTLSYGRRKLTVGRDYTVSYKNNTEPGIAHIIVTGKGNYTGSKDLTFSIVKKVEKAKKVKIPKTRVKSLKAKSKKRIVVRWRKTKHISGYQIRYAPNKKFRKGKTVKVKGAKATSKTIRMKRAKKMYYVKVRTYAKVNGKMKYSSWSKAKHVKTKR